MRSLVDAHQVERFGRLVGLRVGLHLDDTTAPALVEALRLRLTEHDLPCESYLEWLERDAGPDEFKTIARELTTSETYFFREPAQLDALVDVVLPDRIRIRSAERRLSILSAGCASGEEAYSLAIRARDALPDDSWQVSVLGVDINPSMVELAVVGRYSGWSLRATSEDLRRRWFHQQGSTWTLNAEARVGVRFEQRNLADCGRGPWQPGRYDVVFCRNVLMYLTQRCAREIVGRFATALAPGGCLFVGSVESLRGLSDEFDLQQTEDAIFYRRSDRRCGSAPPRPAGSVTRGDPPSPEVPSAQGPDADWSGLIDAAAERVRAMNVGARGPDPEPVAPAGAPARDGDLRVPLDMLRGDRFGHALDALGSLPPASARDPDAMLLRAVLLAQSGDFGTAEDICQELLAMAWSTAGAHFVFGSCRAARGDPAGAAGHYRAAVAADPRFSMAHLHLGLLARRAGDRALARREFQQALGLLAREDASRLLLFGGGFSRSALIDLCRAELAAGGDPAAARSGRAWSTEGT
jgi:chemotaxis protein methyltransferase CheR